MNSQTFDDWASEHHVCTDFVGAYLRENPHATAVHGTINGDDHTWVYDPTIGDDGATIDATLSQFAGFVPGCETDDWFHGDTHPVATETARYNTLEAFANGPGGTYLLEA